MATTIAFSLIITVSALVIAAFSGNAFHKAQANAERLETERDKVQSELESARGACRQMLSERNAAQAEARRLKETNALLARDLDGRNAALVEAKGSLSAILGTCESLLGRLAKDEPVEE